MAGACRQLVAKLLFHHGRPQKVRTPPPRSSVSARLVPSLISQIWIRGVSKNVSKRILQPRNICVPAPAEFLRVPAHLKCSSTATWVTFSRWRRGPQKGPVYMSMAHNSPSYVVGWASKQWGALQIAAEVCQMWVRNVCLGLPIAPRKQPSRRFSSPGGFQSILSTLLHANPTGWAFCEL